VEVVWRCRFPPAQRKPPDAFQCTKPLTVLLRIILLRISWDSNQSHLQSQVKAVECQKTSARDRDLSIPYMERRRHIISMRSDRSPQPQILHIPSTCLASQHHHQNDFCCGKELWVTESCRPHHTDLDSQLTPKRTSKSSSCHRFMNDQPRLRNFLASMTRMVSIDSTTPSTKTEKNSQQRSQQARIPTIRRRIPRPGSGCRRETTKISGSAQWRVSGRYGAGPRRRRNRPLTEVRVDLDLFGAHYARSSVLD
jgi:hypothetical protein